MANSFKLDFNCSICNKPVDLLTAKTDAAGKAVHEECYVLCVVSPSTPSHERILFSFQNGGLTEAVQLFDALRF